MSNKSLEQALANLLPTHAETLPPELVKHAASLLAQSRTYGSSLKPEEEIARPYVCAEIACKRLRKSLKLPSPLGRPPCPPRVYKKIYTYLEQALLKSSKTTSSATNTPKKPIGTSSSLRTPSKNNSPAVTTAPNGSPLKRPLPTTPPQRAARDHNRTKVALRGKGSNGISSHSSVKDAPSWTMPLIRRICKTSATPTASSASPTRPSFSTGLPPHIFAGVSSILSYISETEPQRGKNQTQFLSPLIASTKPTAGMHEPGSNDDKIYRDRITTLIVAVYFVVLTRMHRGISQSSTSSTLPPDENWDVDTYMEMAAAALTVVGLEGKTYVNDVDVWLSIIMTQNWTVGTEWFDNIPSPSKGGEGAKGNRSEGLAKRAGNGNDDDDDDDDEIVSPQKRRVIRRQNQRRGENRDAKAQGGLQPGLGTMMQDRLNWLSEDMREDYLEWKEGVMKRIHAIEKGMASS
ncbi:origin recognition complex subunit 6 (ORC6) [Histoplasma capsulatum var. duboisii H88]|uniref:Origin recognition complex subunit 6 (ORC6) n=1 Tax=Ajellomyces capsulatus (strain H88) TaxID=544711 RepID=A0A8A1L9Z2_AJEC8|nr:origin recognition complex subunit 6 (ORC6) [Histoplasma capsulatum var. duboisii H88]